MSKSSQVPPRSDRPNVEQKKKLAKELLKAVQRLDGQQAARFTWSLPRFRGETAQDVIREGVVLADAQHVIARESGFESWPKLVEYVRTLESDPQGPVAAFEDAVRAIIRGDAAELKRLFEDHSGLATMRSTRQHHAVLPHYIAANGVENEHQVTPLNAPEIARVLFAAGGDAVVDATCDIYGGGSGSTPLVALVTSGHPHKSGVQADLVREFCQAGACVNGIDDDGMPLSSALGFRYPRAAEALVECGARIDNLPTAAALGRIDLVRRLLDPSLELASKACTFPNPGFVPFPDSTAPHPQATVQQAFVFACMGGHQDVAELLLHSGSQINEGPRRGIAAMHEAAYQGQLSIVRWLLDRGADPTLRDQMWESTVIGWAGAEDHQAIIDEVIARGRLDILDAIELKRYDVVRKQLDANPALANAPNGTGAALRHAAFHGDVELAKMLLAAGADVTLRNEAGNSALDYAEKARHSEVAELLGRPEEPVGP